MELPIKSVENGGRSIAFDCFDTANFITIYGLEPTEADFALQQARDLCFMYDQLWNFSKPESDIARIASSKGEWVDVAQQTVSLLQAAAAFNKTNPLFDVTVGAVTSLWKHAQNVPSPDQISDALGNVGTALLELGDGAVRKLVPDVCVDVGGIAKGFVADELAQQLRLQGITCADIDLGGNLYLIGEHPEGRPWRLEEDLPQDFGCVAPRYLVMDASVSTSSNFLRAEHIDGQTYGHIINPLNGMPVDTDIAAATVIGPSSLQADMLSTVVLANSSEGFEKVADQYPEQCILAVTFDGAVLHSGFPNEYGFLLG